jgi:hypothetical protein
VAKVAATTYDVLKKGVYPARVKSIDEDDGQFGAQFKWIFTITGGKAKGTTIFGWSSQVLSPKSKLRAWAEAVMPDAQYDRPGFVLETDDLVDGECRLVLSVSQGNDGIERNKIESLLPVDDDEEEEREAEPVMAGARRASRPAEDEQAPF